METSSYTKFALMLTISFIVMYTVMFFNVYELNHIYLSLTRTYMTFLMVAPMAVIMLLLMPKMYKNKRLNRIILSIGVLIFVLSLVFLRNQSAIGDSQYMRAMIPHHSSAIMTSKNADLEDPEVKKLAEQIIKAQEEEIAQMKAILERLDK